MADAAVKIETNLSELTKLIDRAAGQMNELKETMNLINEFKVKFDVLEV